MILSLIGIKRILRKYIKEDAETMAFSVILICTLAFIYTELMSVFSVLTRQNVVLSWIITIIVIVLIGIKVQGRSFFRIEKKINVMTLLLLVFGVAVLIISMYTVPYNYDSMTYHLPRLFYWSENQSVDHYAVENTRQLLSPQLPAFINLQIYLFFGTDRFLNLLQTISYLLNGYMVYKLSIKLYVPRKGAILASILFYTAPIAFMEAFTTQVDNFSALILLCFVLILWPYLQVDQELNFNRNTMFRTIILGITVAFGYLSKPSVCIAMLVFLVWLLIICILRKTKVIICFKHLTVAIICIGVILVPEGIRNIQTFGQFIPDIVGSKILVDGFHPKYILICLYKNFTMNMSSKYLYNSADTIRGIGEWLAALMNVEISGETISFNGMTYYVEEAPMYNCDYAVNPTIAWLNLVAVGFFIYKIKTFGFKRIETQFFIAAELSFVAFCTVTKWQPWLTRFMISFFALLIPGIVALGSMIYKTTDRKVINAIAGILIFLSVTELLGLFQAQGEIIRYQIREDDGKGSAYFYANQEEYEKEKQVIDCVNQLSPDSIGYAMGESDYEYPLCALMTEDKNIDIRPVMVENDSNKYEDTAFRPEVIISRGKIDDRKITYNSCIYNSVYDNDSFRIYEREK